MSAHNSETRGDFRCEICRQKSAFHCEHDTPYRDQYLGTYDPYSPRNYIVTSRRSKSENRMHDERSTGKQVNSNTGGQHHETKKLQNPTSNGGMNTGRHGNSHDDAHHQQGKKLHNPTTVDNHPAESSTTSTQGKKSKGCVIL